MPPIIRVENLGKCYRIHHQSRERYTALRDVIARKAKRLLRPSSAQPVVGDEDFWALKDVSFEVNQGEVVGIIGRNGAGKSTLLKILSRITEPTKGRITLNGRVASLLEVGTGFHPELTGRENIYLNGAILGMTKAEIKSKFDEIVAFAEVERFLDTPVKRYSSGMYVRLAFAVAAHLEPEILVVDEVLAVGDAEFQKKCLGKMKDVAGGGRTVLFVSHNMSAVMNLCSRGILLAAGQVRLIGEVNPVVAEYLNLNARSSGFSPSSKNRSGDGQITITDFRTLPEQAATGAQLKFVFEVERAPSLPAMAVHFTIAFLTDEGSKAALISSSDMGGIIDIRGGKTTVSLAVDPCTLAPGNYSLNLWVGAGETPCDWIVDGYQLRVDPGGFVEGIAVGNTYRYPVVLPSTCSVSEHAA